MRTEEKLKDILVYWKEFEIPDYVDRDFDEAYLETDKVLTVTGPRRAGKTFLCFQIIDNLDSPEDNIVYINFEDERLHPLNGDELTKLLEIYREIFEPEEGRIYLFLDEIHVVPDWEKWVRRISERERDIKLVITGSSAGLLPEELSTQLRGRSLNQTVYPFSFSEFLKSRGIEYQTETVKHSEKKPEVKKAFNEFIEYGGFPEVVLEENERLKPEILREYYSTIFQRDIVERHSVNNIQAMKDFFKIRIDSFGSKMTYNKSKNNLRSLGHSVGKATLKRYLSHAENSFLLFELQQYTPKTKNRMRYPRKIYPVDTGLVNAVRFDFSKDWGRALETAVFLELKRRGQEIFYHSGDGECDFVIKHGTELVEAIQVTEALDSNEEREIKGLLDVMERFELDEGLILTEDSTDEFEREGKKVKVEPVWNWLIS